MPEANGQHPNAPRAHTRAGEGGGQVSIYTTPPPSPRPPSPARTRVDVEALVAERWADLNSQGWKAPNAAIKYYEKNVEQLERDLSLAESIRKAQNPELDRIETIGPPPNVQEWAAQGHEIQRLAALGLTPQEIQERTLDDNDGEPWALETIERWANVPIGRIPSIRFKLPMKGFGGSV